jgi:hypothetical protein
LTKRIENVKLFYGITEVVEWSWKLENIL